MAQISMLILDILRKYSDENHTMNQTDILNKLRTEYDHKHDRKSIRRNIEDLLDMGYPIEYTVKPRKNGNDVWTDFWYARDFTEPELRLLIDGLLFSKHVPYKQCQQLVEKLEGLSSEHFKAHVKHIKTLPDSEVYNTQIFHTIAVLDEAISKNRQVAFRYVYYGIDKKPHPKLDEDGTPHEYIINPYQMAAREDKYYLICNLDGKDNIANYRIDRITDIRLLDTKRKAFSQLKDSSGNSLNLGEYMKHHIYMFAGDNARVRFRAVKVMISDIIDIFGKDVIIEEESDTHIIVTVRVNEAAIIRFAQSFAPDVVILEPPELANKMKDWAKKVKQAYNL